MEKEKKETFSWKEITIIILIFIVLVVGFIWFMIILEESNNQMDKVYEMLCSEKGLELYKISEDAPHYSKCYEVDDGILRFYYAHNFKGKWYLREGLN